MWVPMKQHRLNQDPWKISFERGFLEMKWKDVLIGGFCNRWGTANAMHPLLKYRFLLLRLNLMETYSFFNTCTWPSGTINRSTVINIADSKYKIIFLILYETFDDTSSRCYANLYISEWFRNNELLTLDN